MYQRILVPIDGSPTAADGMAEAVKLAKLTNGQIRLMHVVDQLSYVAGFEGYGSLTADVIKVMNEAGERILREAKAQVEGEGVPVDTVLFDGFSGRVSDHVVEQAKSWNADVIVLGTHGRRGIRRLVIGSDAEQIVRNAPVPVLLVRPRETEAAK
ncbi:MAG: universal stress protein [Burkholderiales bacterium]|nr:universal stress protein [Burkholderiales bacterium]